MLDDCSKTRCHNGQPCLAHLQCSTSFVLSPKYYPAMNYSGGTKLFQTWKGFDQNCSMGMRQIFSTLTTLTHSTGSCQLSNDNCKCVNILDDMILAKTVFFKLKSMKARLVLSEKSKARERKRLRDNEIGEVARMKLFFNIM